MKQDSGHFKPPFVWVQTSLLTCLMVWVNDQLNWWLLQLILQHLVTKQLLCSFYPLKSLRGGGVRPQAKSCWDWFTLCASLIWWICQPCYDFGVVNHFCLWINVVCYVVCIEPLVYISCYECILMLNAVLITNPVKWSSALQASKSKVIVLVDCPKLIDWVICWLINLVLPDLGSLPNQYLK